MPDTPTDPVNGGDGQEDKVTPRGATVFLFLMLAGYLAYWAYLWYITVIERGIAG